MKLPKFFWDDSRRILDHFKTEYQQHYDLVKNDKDKYLNCLDRLSIDSVSPGSVADYVQEILPYMKSKHKVPFISTYIHENEHLYFYVYALTSKKEKCSMPAIPNCIAKYVSTPPKEIADRNQEGMHLFLEAMKELSTLDSELYKNNNISALLGANFASHPNIHRGYYDVKKAGVLYVQDYLSKENIRKDTAVLLSSGQFTKSENLIKDYTTTPMRAILSQALAGDASNIAYLKAKSFYHHDTGLALPFDLSLFKKTLPARRMAQSLYESFLQFATMQGLNTAPDDTAEITSPMAWSAFLAFFRSVNTPSATVVGYTQIKPFFEGSSYALRNQVAIPADSPLFPEWVVEDADGGCVALGRALSTGQELPSISLNQAAGIIWDPSAGLGTQQARVEVNVGSFPFTFRLAVATAAVITRNQRTHNSEGSLLGHATRVNDLKISYLALPHEKLQFEAWDKDFKEQRKAQKERNLALASAGQPQEKVLRKPSSHEPIYLGMELEVVMKGAARSRDGHAALIRDIAASPFGDHCIIKSDGSIGEYGSEIVTVPATLAYHKKMLSENFFGAPHQFHKRFMATDRCGIHVHVSKNAISPLKLGQLIAFVNGAKNQGFINAMAGRQQNTYCQRQATMGLNAKGIDISARAATKACHMEPITEKDGTKRLAVRGLSFRRLEHASHYDAINVQNAHTFEIRIFKSSSDPNRITRILEFCESLVKFVRAHGTQQMTVYDYVEFILDKANKKEYPNVVRFLASKNYIGHTRRKAKDPKTGKIINKLLHVYTENKVPFPDSIFHKNKDNYPLYYRQLAISTKKEA